MNATHDNQILTAAAFLAIGWDEAMQKADDKGEDVKERWGMGMDGLIAEVVQFAPVVESVWRDAPQSQRDSVHGVWAYEVIEPVGAWIAARMLADEDVTHANVRAYTLECFASISEVPAPEPVANVRTFDYPLYLIGAQRTRWFFDDVAQFGEACAIAAREGVTVSTHAIVNEMPADDYVTAAHEFEHWARRIG